MRGSLPSLGQGRVGCPARVPIARAPPGPCRASVSPGADGLPGLGSGHQRPRLAGGGTRRRGLEGRVCAHRRGWRWAQGGLEEVCVSVGWAGRGSVFLGRSSEAAFELVSGDSDSDSAGRWRWNLSPNPVIPQDPGGLCSATGTPVPIPVTPEPGHCPCPGLTLPGQDLGRAPGQLRGSGPGTAAPALGLTELLPSARPCRGGRFTGCQSRGQRSAGVRKSISVRSLSTSFHLMKPLFVKAAAWPPIPLKPRRAERPALKEQEGVPFPFAFAIQQAPKTNTPHTEI